MSNPLFEAALRRAVTLSADIEVQFAQRTGGAPVVALLVKARNYAATAIVALASVDPADEGAIRALQNDVTCFSLIVRWLADLVREGFEADEILLPQEIDELAEAVGLEDYEAEDIRRGASPDTED